MKLLTMSMFSSIEDLLQARVDQRDLCIAYLETQLELGQLELSKCEDDLETANEKLKGYGGLN